MRKREEMVDEWAMRLLSDVEKGASANFFLFPLHESNASCSSFCAEVSIV